tara:strand:+ start:700 stop:1323 length:624 start_codon:yes stop_codon:yes gene_type:complete
MTKKPNIQQRIDSINLIIKQITGCEIEPYYTTEGCLNKGDVGNHRGVYYIYPEKNFYFGLAKSNKPGGTVYHRHLTHRAKLDVDLSKLYGPPNQKKEPKWQFPMNWKEGVCRYIIEGTSTIPNHFINIYSDEKHTNKKIKSGVKPGVLDYKVLHKVEIDKLPVIVWNLDNFEEKVINDIETKVITTIWPYCNIETYRKRKKETKNQI